MKEKNFKLLGDDRGSGLLLVMISVSFIAILATVLLGAAYTNLRLKTLDSQARSNYYSAETVIAEIEGALEERSSTSMKTAYEEQLKTFINSSSSERTERLKNTYFGSLYDYLKHPDTAKAGKYDPDKLKSFASATSGLEIVDYSSDPTSRGALVMDIPNAKLTLKDVHVVYVNNGIKSSIKTDIVIGLPSTETDTVGYLDYALISDELVNIQTGANATVGGGIYAGDKRDGSDNGIRIDDSSQLNVVGTGNSVISRSDVRISNTASMTQTSGELWTKNIVLGSTTDYKVNNYATGTGITTEIAVGPSININGKTNVKGDLYLNARYSSATFTDSYYGYAKGDAGSATSNSAIVINGYGSSLDMGGVNELLVAGRSFVSGNSGHTHSDSTYTDSASDVMEGESIATKKNETIYLVNSNLLSPAVGSNPASQDKVASLVGGETPGSYDYAMKIIKTEEDPTTHNQVFISQFKDIYDNYLDHTKPILCYFTQNPKVVYFYLNFESTEKAAAYVREYYTDADQKDIFDSNLDLFLRSNSIKLNASGARYEVLGAAIANFNGSANKSIQPAQAESATLSAEISNIDDTYISLQTFLRKYSGSDEARFNQGYVASVINVPNIKADTTPQTFTYPGGTSANYKMKVLSSPSGTSIYLIDNEGDAPFVVREGMENGIIVATGDVELGSIPSTNPYRGLVMAVGKIYTNTAGAACYNADADLLRDLFSSIGKDELDKYFNEYPGGTTLTVNYADYIGFENWEKDAE